MSPKRFSSLALGSFVFLFILGLHLWSLRNYPAPFVDEAFYAARAQALLADGIPFGVLDAGVIDTYPSYWRIMPLFPAAIHAAGVALLPTDDLLTLRLISLLFGILLVAAVFYIGKLVGGYSLGFLASVFLSLSWSFFHSGHMGRYDIIAAALGYSAVAVIAYAKSEDWKKGLLAGILLGLAFEVHPNALIFILTAAILLLIVHQQRLFRIRHFWGLVAGLSITAVFFLLVHILPDPMAYFAINRKFIAPTHTPPILALSLSGLDQLLIEQFIVFWRHSTFGILFFLIAIISAFSLPSTKSRLLAWMLILLTATFTLLVDVKFSYTLIYIQPAVDLLVANFLVFLFRRPWRESLARDAFRAVAAGVVVVSFILKWPELSDPNLLDYQRTQTQINAVVQPGDVIMGSQTYWFGLQQHRYLSWEQLRFYQWQHPAADLEAAFLHFKPDLFIIDGHLDSFITSAPGSDYLELTHLPERELFRILARQGRLVEEFNGGHYRNIRIYRLDWDQ